MSDATSRDSVTAPDDDGQEARERLEDLRARVDLLEEENRRLRQEYTRATRSQYQRAALGLGVIGFGAIAGALLFPAARRVFLVLGAIGVFGAVLTHYLTPERFVTAETGERVYAATAATIADLVGQLGLSDARIYVPVEGSPPARLFIPQHRNYVIPDVDTLDHVLVVGGPDEERGVSIVPTGAYLFEEFERTLAGPLGESPRMAIEQATDAVIEVFELADATEMDIDTAGGRASIVIHGSVFGGPERFDNPLASLIAVTLAHALEKPIQVEVTGGAPGDEESFTVTCRWDAEDGASDESDEPNSPG